MVDNDSAGELTGYRPGQTIELVRNPNWEAASDWRPAFLDSISVEEGFSNPASAADRILAGSGQVNGDFALSPTALKHAAQAAPGQLQMVATGGTRYMPFDTSQAPFDQPAVRKAAISATDRVALRNTLGGRLAGPVASHFLPPGFLGFEHAGGLRGPAAPFLSHPRGDLDLARRYMRQAGYDSGSCQGSCVVTLVADSSHPGIDAAEIVKEGLAELGFEVRLSAVSAETMYSRFCTVPSRQPDLCPNLGWVKEFNDPQGMLQAAFSGAAVSASNNSNWSQLDDPAVNRAINRAVAVEGVAARAKAWGRVDRLIVAAAPAIPWNWIYQPEIRSADVRGVINSFTASWDLAFTSLAQ